MGVKIMFKKLLTAAGVCFLLCFSSCDWEKQWPDELLTVPEKTGYSLTSTHAEVMSFIETIKEKSPMVHVEKMAESIGGKYVPLVVIANPSVTTPEEAVESGKPVIYIQANIHAGEVDPKEAVLEIMREILFGRDKKLLSDQILLFSPIYNADGNDKMSGTSRPNDVGPTMAGQRASGEGYDLNRDGIKADAVETKGLLKNVLLKWDPALIVDMHTTNGSWHGYSLTYAPPYNPVGHQGPAQYMYDTMLPAITKNLDNDFEMKVHLYGIFSGYPPTMWYNFSHQPRFISNYIGLRNRMAILSESFAHDPFEKRILSSRRFVTAIIEYTNEHGRAMAEIIQAADNETVTNVIVNAGSFEKGVDFDVTSQDETIDLLVYKQVPVVDPQTGEENFERTDEIITVSGVELVNKYEPIKLSTFPRGYLFPAELTSVAEKLMEHGIVVSALDEPLEAEGEEFVVTVFNRRDKEFQKHHPVTLEGYFQSVTRQFQAGTYHVNLAQPLANLAFYMLEPESDDGMVSWNFFDDYLTGQGVEAGAVTFPVFKYYVK